MHCQAPPNGDFLIFKTNTATNLPCCLLTWRWELTLFQVGSIPKELSTCTSLEELYLHDNRLWGKIPDSLRALRGLRYLYLYRVSHATILLLIEHPCCIPFVCKARMR